MKLCSVVYLALLLVITRTAYSVATTEPAPTSQPTIFFVAPSVPDEVFDTGMPVAVTTIYPTTSPTGSQDSTGSTLDSELAEETRTAINTSSYIFYTFVGLIGTVGAAYIAKRFVNKLSCSDCT